MRPVTALALMLAACGNVSTEPADAPRDSSQADAKPVDAPIDAPGIPRSCATATGASGLRMIDMDGSGPDAPVQVFCDLDSPPGWTLVLAYTHAANTNNTLKPGTIPLAPDGSFSHFSSEQLAKLLFTEVRFYCKTSRHNRVIHFSTTSSGIVSYFKGLGANSAALWQAGFTTLTNPNHTANIPGAIVDGAYDKRDNLQMTDFPFYKGSLYHWGIRGVGDRWECDDIYDTAVPATADDAATTHRIWVR